LIKAINTSNVNKMHHIIMDVFTNT